MSLSFFTGRFVHLYCTCLGGVTIRQIVAGLSIVLDQSVPQEVALLVLKKRIKCIDRHFTFGTREGLSLDFLSLVGRGEEKKGGMEEKVGLGRGKRKEKLERRRKKKERLGRKGT